ncbi:acyl-CoA dehydrogenase family protein [Streptantibioticus rubrisoli]|uniref:Acyl-CoA dehydrogenase family protein n=1 Tax=Streptantibioticus rubrisoli TaxID=1387313 RepID=A0ABT1P932_9ACTN|nr:acyl-CoA dehydrogenase family protein [Streptantibioticus rubrisoli]MCQ4041869.1 acyl-CoA dehydrogenase family protein [Streptantibioticus rubrisoli]
MSGTATDAVVASEDFWQRVADEVGDDLAVDALDRDRAGKPPDDEVARLRESGLPAALVPPGAAGGGMAWQGACAVIRRIAAADGSMAELLGRHYVLSWSPRFFGAAQRTAALEALAVREQWLWAGEIGSPDPYGDPCHNDEGASLTLVPATGGYLLSGHRALATAITVADRLVLHATCTATDATLVVLVDPHRPGVSRSLRHDRFGQRLAGAGTVHFDDVVVGLDEVVGAAVRDEDVVPPFAALAPMAMRLMLAHVALGIAEGALAEARDLSHVAFRTRPIVSGSETAMGDLLLSFGRLALTTTTASAVIDRATAAMAGALGAGRGLDHRQFTDTAAHVAAAEAVTVEAALLTGERVLELTDAEGLDRYWRNIRTLVGSSPSAPTLRSIGDHFLHAAGSLSAPWS